MRLGFTIAGLACVVLALAAGVLLARQAHKAFDYQREAPATTNDLVFIMACSAVTISLAIAGATFAALASAW